MCLGCILGNLPNWFWEASMVLMNEFVAMMRYVYTSYDWVNYVENEWAILYMIVEWKRKAC